jgi:hypothetical protein
MSNSPQPSPRPAILRRWWKPATATGAGGTAAVIWFEELILFAEEIITLVSITILAGVIYLLNILMFNARMPKKEK